MFYGYDYTELAEKWGIAPPPEGVDENIYYLTTIRWHIQEIIAKVAENKEEVNPKIQDMRDFLKALIKESEEVDYCTPVWKGLLKIEEPYTFCHLFIALLPYMWT